MGRIDSVEDRDRLMRAPVPELRYFLSSAHAELYRIRGRLTMRHRAFVLSALVDPASQDARVRLAVRDALWWLAREYSDCLPRHVRDDKGLDFRVVVERNAGELSFRRQAAAIRVLNGQEMPIRESVTS